MFPEYFKVRFKTQRDFTKSFSYQIKFFLLTDRGYYNTFSCNNLYVNFTRQLLKIQLIAAFSSCNILKNKEWNELYENHNFVQVIFYLAVRSKCTHRYCIPFSLNKMKITTYSSFWERRP